MLLSAAAWQAITSLLTTSENRTLEEVCKPPDRAVKGLMWRILSCQYKSESNVEDVYTLDVDLSIAVWEMVFILYVWSFF